MRILKNKSTGEAEPNKIPRGCLSLEEPEQVPDTTPRGAKPGSKQKRKQD